jgi:hypothetical protein
MTHNQRSPHFFASENGMVHRHIPACDLGSQDGRRLLPSGVWNQPSLRKAQKATNFIQTFLCIYHTYSSLSSLKNIIFLLTHAHACLSSSLPWRILLSHKYFSISSFEWLVLLQSRTNSPLAINSMAHFCLNIIQFRLPSSLLNVIYYIGVVSVLHWKEQNLVIDFISRQFCNCPYWNVCDYHTLPPSFRM